MNYISLDAMVYRLSLVGVMIIVILLGVTIISDFNQSVIDFCKDETGLHTSNGMTFNCTEVNDEWIPSDEIMGVMT